MALTDRKDVSSEPLDPSEEQPTPQGYLEVSLSDEQRLKLEGWVKGHLDQIEGAMAEPLSRFQRERNQLEGSMPGADYPYPGAFRVDCSMTKRKVRELANRVKQAYLDSDPIWAINTDQDELMDYAEQVEKALDHAVRNALEAEDDLAQAFFEAVLHGAGFLVPGWAYREEEQRNLETYEGFDGTDPASLEDLYKFEEAYPNWKDEKETRKLHGLIARGTTVKREVTYTAPTVNRPDLHYVEARDVRVYPSVDGMPGLRSTPVYGYMQTYTGYELEEFAQDESIDQAQLDRITQKRQSDRTDYKDQMEEYSVFKATITYDLNGDKTPSKFKIWYERDSHVILRIRAYQWWYHRPDLIPLYVRLEDPGFFKRGIAWDLLHDHTVLNVMLNLLLNAIDLMNSMRFKVKEKSLAEKHLIARRWSPHLPLPYKNDPNEIEPMQMSTGHLPAMVQAFELLRRQADESTQTTSLQSGRESPTDPSAPASKTAMLLQQVEPNLKELFRSLEPGFREAGRWVLWQYYQGMSLGWIDTLPGLPDVPLDQLPKIAEHLNPRAMLFEFDREGRQQRNLMLFQVLVSTLGPQHPAIPKVLKTLVSQWDSYWSRQVNALGLDAPVPLAPAPAEATPGASPLPTPAQPQSQMNGGSPASRLPQLAMGGA